jgi:hypothetical protein
VPPSRRFTVAGLQTRFALEDALRNVFVEGPTDKKLISWFLEEAGVRAIVFEIEAVHVPPAEVLRRGFSDNNRGRVLTLAALLANGTGTCPPQASLVIDADFDYLFERRPPPPGVLATDGASSETYCFSVPCIEKFLRLNVGLDATKATRVMKQLEQALIEAFLVRATAERLNLGLRKLEITKVMDVDSDGSLTFDQVDYLERYLDKNGKRGKAAEFKDALVSVREIAAGITDPRRLIHGHELVEVISLITRRVTPHSALNASGVAAALAMSINFEELRREPMLAALLSRVARK